MFFIPPEIVSYFDLKLGKIFFFGLRGWFLQKVSKSTYLFYSLTKLLVRTIFSSALFFNNLIFGLIKSYFKFIQLRGRSFRYLCILSNLILKFGYSHKLYYLIPNNICVTLITKQVLKISGKSLQRLKHIFFDLHSIRKFDKYTGKGLLYYKDSLVLKASSKKTKV